MKKVNKTQVIVTSVVCLLPVLLALALWDKLPAQLPIHFDASGAVDNYGSKTFTCFGLPALMLLINLLVHFGISADPKRENANNVIVLIGLWCCPILSLILMPIVLFKSLGYNIPIEVIVPALVGLMFIIIGNYMPKSRQSYTVGIKLPWTLNDEENWNKTHRFAGFVWVLCGLITLVCSFLGGGIYVILVDILLLAGLPILYSYILYRKKVKKKE